MPWVSSGDVTILRGGNAIIVANAPTSSPYIFELNFYSDTLVAHWGTLFVEPAATLNGASQRYVIASVNFYRKRQRFDLPALEGGSGNLRIHITKKAAFPSYRILGYRFT